MTREAPWYEEAFRAHYLEVYAHRDDEAASAEVEFALRALSLAPGDLVLDLACGAGRHARALAARGIRVVGQDLSADLIKEARRRCGGVAGYIRGDMRRLPLARGFDAVLLFFTSFGYFEEEEDDIRVLSEVASVLRAGGGLLLDAANREKVMKTLVPESNDMRSGATINQRRWISADGRRVMKRVTIATASAAPVAYTESVRLYAPEEIDSMLAGAGFTVTGRYGDLAGARLAPESDRFVAVGRLEC